MTWEDALIRSVDAQRKLATLKQRDLTLVFMVYLGLNTYEIARYQACYPSVIWRKLFRIQRYLTK